MTRLPKNVARKREFWELLGQFLRGDDSSRNALFSEYSRHVSLAYGEGMRAERAKVQTPPKVKQIEVAP